MSNNVSLHEQDLKKTSKQQLVVKILCMILVYAFLCAMALVVLFPFYWMISSSLKTLAEYQQNPPTFFPQKIMWTNYVEAFKTANLGRLFTNTLYVGVVSTILSLIITVLSAFAFARLEFKGKNALFAALLATMMIPGELFTITNYVTVSDAVLGWTNTYTVLIVPFLVSVFYIYLLRQNFLQIPNELYLAAKTDGTSDLRYLMKVMIPICRPTITTIVILKIIECWNAYVWPRLITDNQLYFLVSNGIQEIRENGFGRENIPAMMAAVVVISIPLIILFLIFHKRIMEGVSRGGTKGI